MSTRTFAIVVLLGVCAFGAYTIYSRLHDGCSYHGGGRRRGGWDCAATQPPAPLPVKP